MLSSAAIESLFGVGMSQYIFDMVDVSKVAPGSNTAAGNQKFILKGIYLSFLPGAKIGVLGVNGSGKSTLLRIMAGVDKEFEGVAKPQPGIKIGYLAQEPEIDLEKTVREVVEEGVADVKHALAKFDEISC